MIASPASHTQCQALVLSSVLKVWAQSSVFQALGSMFTQLSVWHTGHLLLCLTYKLNVIIWIHAQWRKAHTVSALSQFQMPTVTPGARSPPPPTWGAGAILLTTLHIKCYLWPCKSPHYSLGAIHNKARISPAVVQIPRDWNKLCHRPSRGARPSAHPRESLSGHIVCLASRLFVCLWNWI